MTDSPPTRGSLILRLADGLDRGHAGAVKQVKVRWLKRAVRIMLLPHARATALRLEVWGATRKADLLERIAGRAVELVARDGSVYEKGEDGG